MFLHSFVIRQKFFYTQSLSQRQETIENRWRIVQFQNYQLHEHMEYDKFIIILHEVTTSLRHLHAKFRHQMRRLHVFQRESFKKD